ncbi:MAG TPA: cell division protein FtsQ/DivIB [Gammaproteobacteria bacterium]|jgi:cell division protein FtsQ|nr:cell division protein FtsQ/DivIB [Gammaproteobacteria bacterium]
MNTRKPDQPVKFWRRRIVVVGAGATLVLAVAFGLLLWLARPLLAGPRLTTLTLGGRLQHVDPAAVRNAVLPELGSGFFNTRVERIGAALDALPWVAEADVRREWPHTLRVDIVEEVPVARWGDAGLMDAQGKVFVHDVQGRTNAAGGGMPGAASAYSNLPMLSGRDDASADVLAQYNTLAALVAPRGIAIVALSVDARGAATVELDDGIEVRLGREDASARLARFSALALPALAAKLTTVAYVDMRYTNGFAVGWKNGKNGNQGTRPNA